jgi:transcriptional regulator with XRE-family HTH domain
MHVLDRVRLLKTLEGISYVELCERTGIDKKRLENVINEKAKIRHEEIEAIGAAWPEYRLWIAYGDELPEAGQISPMTKKAMEELGTLRKAE